MDLASMYDVNKNVTNLSYSWFRLNNMTFTYTQMHFLF